MQFVIPTFGEDFAVTIKFGLLPQTVYSDNPTMCHEHKPLTTER